MHIFYFSFFHVFNFVCFFYLFFSPVHIAFSCCFFHFTHIPNNTLYWVFYFLFFLFRLSISYHNIVIPHSTHHPFLLLSHFTIFQSFTTVVVNFIFSHTTPSFYPLLSLFLLHIPLHKHSYFLSQLTFSFPSNKSLISFSHFINSGQVVEIPWLLLYFSKGTPTCSILVCTLNTIE